MELDIKYHILFFIFIGILLSFLFFLCYKKKKKRYALVLFYFFLFYFVILIFVLFHDLVNQHNLSKYDINQNGIFEQNEQNVEQEALMYKNDLGINLSPFFVIFISFPIAIISAVVHIKRDKKE